MVRKGMLFVVFLMVFLLSSCGKPDNNTAAKPVIYLYPKETSQIEVKLEFDGELSCTYPNYQDGWNVLAQPDGTLKDLNTGRQYSYLFWEGRTNKKWDIKEGFVVARKDTAEFLQDKLSYLGLTPKEYNEFIVYWLPRMQENKYNLIHFAGEEYENLAKLSIDPQPDSILRVFMVYKALDKPMDIKKQELEPFERAGFTAIEWGGTELAKTVTP